MKVIVCYLICVYRYRFLNRSRKSMDTNQERRLELRVKPLFFCCADTIKKIISNSSANQAETVQKITDTAEIQQEDLN